MCVDVFHDNAGQRYAMSFNVISNNKSDGKSFSWWVAVSKLESCWGLFVKKLQSVGGKLLEIRV